MITAHDLHRLLLTITDNLIEGTDSQASGRRALAEYAEAHNLGLQDTATLYRVAAGEAPHSPIVRWVVVEDH